MTWTKIGDEFCDETWSLSNAAFRLHMQGLCWSNKYLLDCRIPADDVRRFAKEPGALPELLETGYWAQDGDEYVIRHHAAYQRTREQVIAQQSANLANGKKGGRPPKPKPPKPETQSVTDSVSDSVSERVSVSVSGPPEPRPTSASESPGRTAPETHSVSESPSESRTERDRYRTGTYYGDTTTEARASDEPEEWPKTAHVPGTCTRCHRELPRGLGALGRTSHEPGTCPTEGAKP